MSLMHCKNVIADGDLHPWKTLCSYKKFAGNFYRSSSKSIDTCL